MKTCQVHTGDAARVLAGLPAESVQCCVTSPPYWGLRDYGVDGQLGLEPTPEQYVERMVEIFREVKRVLRDDATLWLNLGDSFDDKNLVGIPWRVAFALQADGWYLRSDIIWAKPNPMPESITDRPTKSHEYLFLLTKSARYYYDADAIREKSINPDDDRKKRSLDGQKTMPTSLRSGMRPGSAIYPHRNRRSVWTIAPQPFPGAHFAVFPPALVEPCIKAGTSERGCCSKCGKPFNRVTERSPMVVREGPGRADLQDCSTTGSQRTACTGTMLEPPKSETVGWEPGCDCGVEIEPCLVLDPFAGAGTVGLVALRLARQFLGVELNPEYADMTKQRIEGDAPLFNRVTVVSD